MAQTTTSTNQKGNKSPVAPTDPQQNVTLPLEELLAVCRGWQGSSEGQHSAVGQEFCRIQQDIFSVMGMRKNMETILEVESLQSQHFATIQKLVAHNQSLQQTVDQTAISLKHIENQQIEKILNFYNPPKQPLNFQELSRTATSAKMQLQDMMRSLRLQSPPEAEVEAEVMKQLRLDSEAETGAEMKQSSGSGADGSVLARRVYQQHFRDLNLREELIEERENAFLEYQLSNNQLVEVLLSEREKDRNLQRAQQEKHQQLLSVRHRFDIQLETLSHHQSNLVSLYEMDLLALKKKASKAEEDLEQARGTIRVLEEELLAAKKESLELQTQLAVCEQTKLIAEQQVQSIKAQAGQLQGEKESKDQELQLLMQRESQLLQDISNLQTVVSELRVDNNNLAAEKEELVEHRDSLQSQLNETILRSSQTSKTKQELARKLQKNTQQLQYLTEMLADEQTKNAVLQNNIDNEEATTKQLKQSLATKERQLTGIRIQLQASKKQILELHCQRDHSQSAFQQILREKGELACQLQQGQKQKELTVSDWQEVREAVRAQLRKSMQDAAIEVDCFVERMSQYQQLLK